MAKNLFRGQTTVNNIYRGNTLLNKVYRGQDVVWEAEAGFNPPITADVFAFHAATYSGTGDWIDDTNSYPAALVSSPSFVSDGFSSYWNLNGTSTGFNVDSADIPDALFSSMGTFGAAEGSAEFVVFADDLTSDFRTLMLLWSASESNRQIIIGSIKNNNFDTLYQTGTGTSNRTYVPHGALYTDTNVWKHVIITWSQPNNAIKVYINNTLLSTKTFTSNEAWVVADNCLGLGYYVEDCNQNIRRHWSGRWASARAYNDELTSTQVSTMYSFWQNYFTFA